jgi:uncharacterized protein (TIGR02757 family)
LTFGPNALCKCWPLRHSGGVANAYFCPMKWRNDELKEYLEAKYELYNRTGFIESDPISIPHKFTLKEDIEIAGFLTATIAWGQRPTIIRNANTLLQQMDHAPHEFITHFKTTDLKPFRKFVHRTFNGTDCVYFLKALQKIYNKHRSIENLFINSHVADADNYKEAIAGWRKFFFNLPHEKRIEKHFANPLQGSAAKKINMYLRWMIRPDNGVDFGLWRLPPSLLTCPLDVHTARVARALGLLKRKIDDWKAAEELTHSLRRFDPLDPVKYDIALFGLGVEGEL